MAVARAAAGDEKRRERTVRDAAGMARADGPGDVTRRSIIASL